MSHISVNLQFDGREEERKEKSGKHLLLSHTDLLTFLFMPAVNPIHDFAGFVVMTNFQCLWDDWLVFQFSGYLITFPDVISLTDEFHPPHK